MIFQKFERQEERKFREILGVSYDQRIESHVHPQRQLVSTFPNINRTHIQRCRPNPVHLVAITTLLLPGALAVSRGVGHLLQVRFNVSHEIAFSGSRVPTKALMV